jgi:hypothetical protein
MGSSSQSYGEVCVITNFGYSNEGRVSGPIAYLEDLNGHSCGWEYLFLLVDASPREPTPSEQELSREEASPKGLDIEP